MEADNFTKNILDKLKIIISLKILHSEDRIREIYREIAKAKTPGMLLKASEKLPPEEIEICKRILDGEDKKAILKPFKYQKNKNITPAFSFKFSDGDFKRKQRLEVLDRIRKNKLKK